MNKDIFSFNIFDREYDRFFGINGVMPLIFTELLYYNNPDILELLDQLVLFFINNFIQEHRIILRQSIYFLLLNKIINTNTMQKLKINYIIKDKKKISNQIHYLGSLLLDENIIIMKNKITYQLQKVL